VVDSVPEEGFALALRIPPWSVETQLRVCGEDLPVAAEDGYVRLERTWSPGDRVGLRLDMRGRVVKLPRPAGIPQQPFSAIASGPLVLARDIRLGDAGDIHAPVLLAADKSGKLDLVPVAPPDDIWLAYRAPVEAVRKDEAECIHLCDFSSAGNTWDVATSDFRVWLPDTVVDPRTGA
jgi:hypothetical protein